MSLKSKSSAPGAETILHGEFGAFPSKTTRYALSLTVLELHVQKLVPKPEDDRRTVVSLSEVIGCHTLRSQVGSSTAAFFSLYSYPLKRRKMGMGKTRHRTVQTFRVDCNESYAENHAIAEKWATAIKCLLAGVKLSTETDITSSLLPRSQRLLLLVNPFGGRGQAMHYCHTFILPMLTEASINYNLIQTERQNHVRELMRDINLSEWDGIVIASGDGLLYEVVNGLMERPDWEKAIKIPLGILPCGSGNALAGAVNFSSGYDQVIGEELLMNCTFLLCRHVISPMDLVSVTTGSGQRMFSFLSVAWGFVSDVDIESEKYRRMGSARFTIGTMVRVASLRTYRGRLSYLPTEEGVAHRPMSKSVTICANGFKKLQRKPLQRTISDLGICEERNVLFKRNSTIESTNTVLMEYSPSPCSPAVRHSTCFNFEPIPEGSLCLNSMLPNGRVPATYRENGYIPAEVLGPPDDLLNPLDQPVPKNWVTVEDDFVLVLAIYQTHLGADLFAVPFGTINDGLIHLFFVRAGISRAALVRLFLAMEKGTHFEQECQYLTYVPVKAFRLEPQTQKGIITVDGEQIEYGPLQAQLHPELANLITGVQRVRPLMK